MALLELYISSKYFFNCLFKNRRFRILFGPAKGLIWINDLKPNFCYNLGMWEPRKQFIMKRYVTNGMVAYDIGAFHGYFSLVLSRLVGEKGLVYAFEPARENFEYLRNVITLNRLNNVKLCQKAVGGIDKEVYCNFDNSNPMAGCISDQPAGEYKVEMTTLDSFVLKDSNNKPDIVKLDIEGFEYETLIGMDKTINLYHPALFIDVHSKENHRACIKFLKERGYKVEILAERAFRKGGFLSDIFAFFEKS